MTPGQNLHSDRVANVIGILLTFHNWSVEQYQNTNLKRRYPKLRQGSERQWMPCRLHDKKYWVLNISWTLPMSFRTFQNHSFARFVE